MAERRSLIVSERENHTIESRRKNDLDKYLEDVFEQEVKFKTDDSVSDFIQSSVENTVAEIISFVQTCETDAIQMETKKLMDTFPYLRKRNKQRSESMLKVGSYYEGTKIGFPYEFDFVFIVGEFESEKAVSSVMRYREGNSCLHNAIIKGLSAKSSDMPEKYRKTIFHIYDTPLHYIYLTGFYLDQRGPSTKLIFNYMNSGGYKRNIFVDLVPAFKINEKSTPVPADKKRNCPQGFHSEIEKTGSILLVEGRISFTPTEVYFMKNVLSPKHKMVYKIVKYLINGHDCAEMVMEKLIKFGLWRYNFGLVSSYMIKTEIIFHHYKCKNSENKTVADCVLDLLETIKDIESDKPLRMLSDYYRKPRFYQNRLRYNSLRDMIQEFEIMKTCYMDKQVSFTPINKIFLEQKNNDIHVEIPPEERTEPFEYFQCCCIAFKYLLIGAIICIFVFFVVFLVLKLGK